MRIVRHPTNRDLGRVLARPEEDPVMVCRVQQVLDEVREGGDAAVLRLLARYEQCGELDSYKVTQQEIEQSVQGLPQEVKQALSLAMDNVRRFHENQLPTAPDPLEVVPGLTCWKKYTPLERVGVYVPAGSAPLFSSLYMAAIAAQTAGVREIAVCAPPQRDGSIHASILYVAKLLGITEIYKLGGATAIAALAYGTESITPVDKIAGPGSLYTSIAKQLLASRVVDIDIVAGPSEVLVICDEHAQPHFVAADLLAQAEHGATSQVVLVATSEPFIQRVLECVTEQLAKLPRASEAEGAMGHSVAILVDSLARAIEVSNLYGPEHLIIACKNAKNVARGVQHAGSVFVGDLAAEVLGDYGSGTNHILPTGGWARRQGGVSPLTFMKGVTFQEVSALALAHIGPPLALLARTEGLEAHARAIEVRLSSSKSSNSN